MEMANEYLQIKGTLVGVDIGYDTVKIISLNKKGNFNYLRSSNIIKIEPKSIQQKQSDLTRIAQTISYACKTAKPRISEKLIVSGLPESKVFTKIIQIPQMDEDELKTAIPYEAARHIPLPQNELYMDWQNLGLSDKKALDVLVVAAPKYLVENYLNVFNQVGLELIALETKPIAAARAIVSKNEQGPLLILDIGAAATGITIYDMGSIKFTYTIPHGGNTLTKSISVNLRVPIEEAEKLKVETGFKKDDHPETIQAMEEVMKDIIEEINNAIKYYENRSKPPRKITNIRICGGGALTPHISQYISDATKKTTIIANPFINVAQNSWKHLNQEQILRFTTAVGLALRENY